VGENGRSSDPLTLPKTELVESESVPEKSSLATAPTLAVQFFLIPLAVVGVVVLVYGGFRTLVTTERTPEEFLNDIQTGGRERRWPAAYELSRLLADPEIESQYPSLGASIVKAFAESEGDDPRVRRYLALAVGQLKALPSNAVGELIDGLEDPDSETSISVIWALASVGDELVVPAIEAMYASTDAGVRKMAVYALGVLPSGDSPRVLLSALDDEVSDVQWNAAVALARHGREDGLKVLSRMLNRDYVERTVNRTGSIDATLDPVSEVMVSGLQAVAVLKAEGLRVPVAELSRDDVNLRVREVAIRTLEAFNAQD